MSALRHLDLFMLASQCRVPIVYSVLLDSTDHHEECGEVGQSTVIREHMRTIRRADRFRPNYILMGELCQSSYRKT
jgi:hypothetical protein